MSAPRKKNLEILGNSPRIAALKALIARIAPSATNVLVVGESGTGKELVARSLHDLSPVAEGPFVAVNCGAIPENLIESELFGHKKGSFTGAIADKQGLFEVANGGTLFLDEIGELPLGLQVKLLRALQDRTIRRVGGNETIKIDARIVAATNRNLEEAMKKGTFREDLYYRLNVIMLETPPLRDRVGDIELLADVFLKKFTEKQEKTITGFSPEAKAILLNHPWPGNVRELENVMERVVTLENGEIIRLDGFPPEMLEAARKAAGLPREMVVRANFIAGPVDVEKIIEEVRAFLRREALTVAANNPKEAARLLGVSEEEFSR